MVKYSHTKREEDETMKETTQLLMDEVHAFWNITEENSLKSKNEILQHFSPAHSMAMRFGHFNYEIENGGIRQWIENGRMKDDIEELLTFTKMAKEWDIPNIYRFGDVFQGVKDGLKGWEEQIEEKCCICDGDGEIENTDEEEEGDTVICDECGGSGEITMENPYPAAFKTLEKQYFELTQDERISVLNMLIDRQLQEQEKERQIVTISLKRGTETVVIVEENPNTNVLHVLDLDKPETTSLTNAIEEVQEYLQTKYASTRDMYLYHTDGFVTEYKDGNFHHVAENDERIYVPFFLQIPEVQMN